jgi:hypothetical protein
VIGDVKLFAPADLYGPSGGLAVGAGHGDPDDDVSDGFLEELEGERWGRSDDSAGILRVDAVEADHGVEMDQAAQLVFGHLAERQPAQVREGSLAESGEGGQLSAEFVRGGVPELGGHGVPDDGAEVVVAVGVEGLAEQLVLGAVQLADPCLRFASQNPTNGWVLGEPKPGVYEHVKVLLGSFK